MPPAGAPGTISSAKSYHSSLGGSLCAGSRVGYSRAVTIDRRTLINTGLAMTATRGRTAPRSYSLQVLGQSNRVVALGARPVFVGAHATCDLVLDDPKVSRRHAELVITTDGVKV